jgi:hypothetical protein
MKNGLFPRVVLGFLLASSVNSAFSQEDSMKAMEPVVIYTKTNVNKEVTDAFDKQFKDAMDPQWFKMNKNYLVSFIMGDTKNNALFKKNGKMIYHISYGNESNLPEDVKKQVHNAYEEYNITRAVNIKGGSRDIWVVNLEGMKRWVIVSIEDGELVEVENYEKAGG